MIRRRAQPLSPKVLAAALCKSLTTWSGQWPQRNRAGRRPVSRQLLALIVCEAAADVRVRVRRGVVDVQIEQAGVRAVAIVATVINHCPMFCRVLSLNGCLALNPSADNPSNFVYMPHPYVKPVRGDIS